MKMDLIKEAFQKIKQEIILLKQEIQQLKTSINQVNQSKIQNKESNQQTDNLTQNPTPIPMREALETPNFMCSTGNGGVPTDKPTNKPTNQQTNKSNNFLVYQANFNDFEQAREILNSLDNIKKEIRLKFKRLTNQEMLVFSAIYRLEEQKIEEITHKMLAYLLNLSESSIRDYVNKLIHKGIPILKIRQNNQKILLKISSDLRKIASLSTIIRLREI